MAGSDLLWHRRALLGAMASLAATPGIARDAGARAIADSFALGVASGDPAGTRIARDPRRRGERGHGAEDRTTVPEEVVTGHRSALPLPDDRFVTRSTVPS